MNQNRSNSRTTSALSGTLITLLLSCDGVQHAVPMSTVAKKQAIQTLRQAIEPAAGATALSSSNVDWTAGALPWDQFTLPVFSLDGLNVAVQLGQPPSIATLVGKSNDPLKTTNIELHSLDPILGKQATPLAVIHDGLILSRFRNNNVVFVEYPKGDEGRWIGKIDWLTGKIQWLVNDDAINAFPTSNNDGDLAWSKRSTDEDRFHIVVQTQNKKISIDDGESDWVYPLFISKNQLRVFRINEHHLSLIELDPLATEPLLTAVTLPLLENGGSRSVALQIATSNPSNMLRTNYAFYHPRFQRMTVWTPSSIPELQYLAMKSIAAAPVDDGSWIVATAKQVLRQKTDQNDAIYLRNQFALPVATTSKQWTHLLLEPRGNQLHVHAINIKH